MLLIETILTIHCLLFLSSLFIGRAWLANKPSFKLKLLRFLLASCIISPIIVHCVDSDQKPERKTMYHLMLCNSMQSNPYLRQNLQNLIMDRLLPLHQLM